MSGRARKKRPARHSTAADRLSRPPGGADVVAHPVAALPVPGPGQPRAWRTWLLALLLAGLTVTVYQPAATAGYIWDDDKYVTENPLLTAPDGLWRIWFSRDSPSQYFPLVYTTFRAEHAIWGLNPTGYHWVNILLHAANALLVWRILRMLAIPGAWLAAALFALHPVQVESVAWITERKNVLMGFFFLLALVAWLRFVERAGRGRWRYYALALLLYALSLFSKTTACTMPAALLLILWLRGNPVTMARLAQVSPFVLLGFAMGLLTIWWERHIQGTQGELFTMGLTDRLLVATRAIWFYAGKLFWPADLAFSYPKWDISASDPADYFWPLLTGVAAYAIYFGRRFAGRGVEVATVYYVAMLSPMLGLIMLYTFRYTYVADHYQYLATAGPLALFAALITRATERFTARFPVLVPALLASALLLPVGVRTWQQCAIYKDEETLWRATIETNPSSWMASNNLGIIHLRRGEVNEAIAHFSRALELDPNYAEAHYNLGNALVRGGAVDDAIARYRRALDLNPAIVGAQVNLATILLQRGRLAEAETHLQQAVARSPRHAGARHALGGALARSGRLSEALDHLELAAQLKTDVPGVHNDLGNALLELGQHEKAMVSFETALRLQPQNAEAHYNLGNTFLAMRRLNDAVTHYRRSAELRPGFAAARNNLANTLVQLDRMDEAIAEYQLALAARPNYAAAHKNLANALRRAGRLEEAARHAQLAADIELQAGSSSER